MTVTYNLMLAKIGSFDLAVISYLVAFFIYAAHAFFLKQRFVGRLATAVLFAGWGCHTWFLVERAIFYHRQHQGFVLPSTNMFEAISYFAWLIVLLYMLAEQFLFRTRVFGMFVMILPVAATAYAATGISPDPRELMPSLKSYWLVFHITMMFLSYSMLALAFTFAWAYVIQARKGRGLERIDKRFNLEFLDATVYSLTSLAVPLLGVGIFLGAVWADSAWGRYWGWDPKETWALITWLIYIVYLHHRRNRGPGYRNVIINIMGFTSVVMTFLGVNLLDRYFDLNSIHAYAEGGEGKMLAFLGVVVAAPVALQFMTQPKKLLAQEARLAQAGSKPAAGAKRQFKLQSPLELIWKWLNSLPVAIGVMITLALLCALGTLIPQEHLFSSPEGKTFAQMQLERYGPVEFTRFAGLEFPATRLAVIRTFGLDKVYFTWYFSLLLGWLCISALVCKVGFLRRTLALWQRPRTRLQAAAYASSPRATEFDGISDEQLSKLAAEFSEQGFRVIRSRDDNGAEHLYADKGMLKHWALVLLHFSLVILLAGIIVGRVWGIDGLVRMADGEQKDLVLDAGSKTHPAAHAIVNGDFRLAIPGTKLALNLDLWDAPEPKVYKLSQDHFRIDYDRKIRLEEQIAQMAPEYLHDYYRYFVKDYVSLLSVTHGDKTRQQEVKVNHPLKIDGLYLYQSSYQQSGYIEIEYDGQTRIYPVFPETTVIPSSAGLLVNLKGQMLVVDSEGATHPVPPDISSADTAFTLMQVKAGDLYVGGEPAGQVAPVCLAWLIRPDSTEQRAVLLTRSDPLEFRIGGEPATIRMAERVDNFSVFSYKRDPGVGLLYIGWILMLLGIGLTMYTPYYRINLYLQDGKARLLPGGNLARQGSTQLAAIHAILSAP